MRRRGEEAGKGEAGMALVTATIFIAVALLAVSALSARYLQQRLEPMPTRTTTRLLTRLRRPLREARRNWKTPATG